MIPEVIYIVDFSCNDDLTVNLRFNDSTTQTIDVGDFIRRKPHPQYNKYLLPVNFKKCRLEDGNIIWGNDLEFHIDELYKGRV